jgi:hypothetical protein
MNEKYFPIVNRYTEMIFDENKKLKSLKLKMELCKTKIKRLEEEKKLIKELYK